MDSVATGFHWTCFMSKVMDVPTTPDDFPGLTNVFHGFLDILQRFPFLGWPEWTLLWLRFVLLCWYLTSQYPYTLRIMASCKRKLLGKSQSVFNTGSHVIPRQKWRVSAEERRWTDQDVTNPLSKNGFVYTASYRRTDHLAQIIFWFCQSMISRNLKVNQSYFQSKDREILFHKYIRT